MKKYFITYGDLNFEEAKRRIIHEAEQTGEFDEIIAYSDKDVSPELKSSEIFSIRRGGGLWSWKPDVMLQTLEKMDENDILVYCDAGCQLQVCNEWKWYWKKLAKHDIIAQRIFQRTESWTRSEVIKEFESNGRFWPKMFQYQATIIMKRTDFSMDFVRQWRNLMIDKPILAMDVAPDKIHLQHSSFKENRHDQAIYSALIYRYIDIPETRNRIYSMWEHIEDLDIVSKQAIRATRLRTNQHETRKAKLKSIIKRIVKDYIYKPFIIVPQQAIYGLINKLYLNICKTTKAND